MCIGMSIGKLALTVVDCYSLIDLDCPRSDVSAVAGRSLIGLGSHRHDMAADTELALHIDFAGWEHIVDHILAAVVAGAVGRSRIAGLVGCSRT